jgi:hypothetical protein
MAAPPPAYNPSASMLPSGGGTIQAMSGGGSVVSPPPPMYNAGASMIPVVKGPILSYDGGGFDDSIQLLGGNPPLPPAAPAIPPAPPAAAPPAAPSKLTAIPNSKPENVSNVATKDIVLFGKSITLENPKKTGTDAFSDSQLSVLKEFGLDGPGASDKEKRDVLQAVFDGKCNTDKPVIFLQNCEPIRRIIQTLALKLLETLPAPVERGATGTSKLQINGVANDEQPTVKFEKGEGGSMNLTISFPANKLSLLSSSAKPKAKNNTNTSKKLEAAEKRIKELEEELSKKAALNAAKAELKKSQEKEAAPPSEEGSGAAAAENKKNKNVPVPVAGPTAVPATEEGAPSATEEGAPATEQQPTARVEEESGEGADTEDATAPAPAAPTTPLGVEEAAQQPTEEQEEEEEEEEEEEKKEKEPGGGAAAAARASAAANAARLEQPALAATSNAASSNTAAAAAAPPAELTTEQQKPARELKLEGEPVEFNRNALNRSRKVSLAKSKQQRGEPLTNNEETAIKINNALKKRNAAIKGLNNSITRTDAQIKELVKQKIQRPANKASINAQISQLGKMLKALKTKKNQLTGKNIERDAQKEFKKMMATARTAPKTSGGAARKLQKTRKNKKQHIKK